MKKHTKMSMLKRILAVVLAAAVAVSILTVPDAEVSAATGKVKSVAVTNLPAKQLPLLQLQLPEYVLILTFLLVFS